jgi:hypothetical protein
MMHICDASQGLMVSMRCWSGHAICSAHIQACTTNLVVLDLYVQTLRLFVVDRAGVDGVHELLVAFRGSSEDPDW